MKQGIRRGVASLGLLMVVSSCTDLTVAPVRNQVGDPEPAASANPVSDTLEPAAAVASIVVSPETVEINAPHYTPVDELSDIPGPSSDGSALEHESANFPTTAMLAVTFKSASGETVPPAELVWTSSNPQLVVVDAYGQVHANDTEVGGVATVTAHLRRNLQVRSSATVTVRNDGQLAIELK